MFKHNKETIIVTEEEEAEVAADAEEAWKGEVVADDEEMVAEDGEERVVAEDGCREHQVKWQDRGGERRRYYRWLQSDARGKSRGHFRQCKSEDEGKGKGKERRGRERLHQRKGEDKGKGKKAWYV